MGLEPVAGDASAIAENHDGPAEDRTTLSDPADNPVASANASGGSESDDPEKNTFLPPGSVNEPRSSGFADISEHWARNEIEIASAHGIVLGTGDGKFSPDRPLTRQEMAVMLDRLLEHLDDAGDVKNPYTDISPLENTWSYDAILKMTHYHVFTGNPDGTFGAEKHATRAQMAVLMDRVAPYLNQTVQASASK